MNQALRQKLANYGVWTYRGAWALEIVAAAIGLTTGIVLGLQAFSASETANAADLVLASAPFFMVALAELTKIPIATLLFSVKWLWKPVLLVFLMLLAAITFETVFMGLERATTLRQLRYQELVEEKRKIEADLQAVSTDVSAVDQDYEVQQAQANIERVNDLAEADRANLIARIEEVDRQLEGQVALTPEAAAVREKLKENELRREQRLEEQAEELRAAVEGFEKQRDSYVERMNSPNATPEQMKQWGDELRALRNPGPDLKAKFSSEISTIDGEISKLRDEFEALRAKLTNSSSSERPAMEERRKAIIAELEASDQKWAVEKEAARQKFSAAQSKEADRTQELATLVTQRKILQDNLRSVETERVAMARGDQVQRIASRVYGKNPEDVGPDEANFISVIWFGSLAALAALAGPITAIVALGLQRIGLATVEEQRPSKLSKLMRKLLLSWRWRRVRSKEVRVEVPTIKEVEKIVKEEVPVEKVIKEILYVPILTDDPEAVRRALSQDLPADVVDLVKVGLKGQQNGSPA